MQKSLIFIGTNSNLALYAEAAYRQGITVAGILDDDYYGQQEYFKHIPVLGRDSDLNNTDIASSWLQNHVFFVATNWSSNQDHARDTVKRRQQIDLCRSAGIQCINLIDPLASVSLSSTLGQGIYIGPFCYIEPDCEIKDFAQIWYGTGMSHGSVVGENSILQRQTGIAARIGHDSYISMWCKIYGHDMLTIGNNVTINPGLYVARDVADGETVRITKTSKRIWQYPVEI